MLNRKKKNLGKSQFTHRFEMDGIYSKKLVNALFCLFAFFVVRSLM